MCQDYVTEKLFNVMKIMIIPIVYGGSDYTKFAPPHSYINANDFNTTQELIQYLHFLDKNPKEYIKYFWWKKHYKVMELGSIEYGMCKLCEHLHKSSNRKLVKTQFYESIHHWLYSGQCNEISKIKFPR